MIPCGKGCVICTIQIQYVWMHVVKSKVISKVWLKKVRLGIQLTDDKVLPLHTVAVVHDGMNCSGCTAVVHSRNQLNPILRLAHPGPMCTYIAMHANSVSTRNRGTPGWRERLSRVPRNTTGPGTIRRTSRRRAAHGNSSPVYNIPWVRSNSDRHRSICPTVAT